MNRFAGGLRPAMTALAVVLAGFSAPAWSQDGGAEARIRKLEAEVRALQRQVFPGGDGKFFPQNTPATTPTPVPGSPATTPVTDLLARMDAVEAQLTRLTAQYEENGNRLRQLEARLATAAPAPPVIVAEPVPTAPVPAPAPATAAPRPAPAAAEPTSARVAAVRAVERPKTSDAAEDEYSYGYRLWEAKFLPEAEQQLKLYLEKYPRHQRVSYARNLLGRAYLDEGKPREAAPWFLQNYQSDKAGARAPDSLLGLGQAMAAMKDTNRACIALAEFAATYPAEAAGRLKATYDATRSKVTCK